MNAEPDDDSTHESAPEEPPSDAEKVGSDPTVWQRTRQGLGKAAGTVVSASAVVASTAASVGSNAASAATIVGSKSATLAANAAKTTVAAGENVVAVTGLGVAIDYLDNELNQRGVKQAIGTATGAIVDRLDQVSGKQLVELLESRLRLQDEYNNVLATRLAEALERIATLEEKLRDGHR